MFTCTFDNSTVTKTVQHYELGKVGVIYISTYVVRF